MKPIDHTLADTQIGVGYGVTTLPHLRNLAIIGPVQRVTGVSDNADAPQDLLVPSRQTRRRGAVRQAHHRGPGHGRVSPARDARRCHGTDAVLPARRRRRRLRRRHPHGGAGHAVESALHLQGRGSAGRHQGRCRVSDQRRRSRVASVVLPVGHDSRSRAGRRGGPRHACRGRTCSSARSGGCWPTRARQRSRRASPRSGCVSRTCRRSSPMRSRSRTTTRRSPRRWRARRKLLFDHLVRADRPVMELVTADYTFVNERLARHYGIAGVSGPTFRQVSYPDDTRRGILGHGSILTLTSHGNRTSPVLRGKWVHGSAAGQSAAAAAAQRAGSGKDERCRQRPHVCRWPSRWRCIAPIRPAARVTSSSIRLVWRSTTST